MKVLVLYRPNSEHARMVETFLRDFERQYAHDIPVEILSLDTRDGASTASLYDIVQYPGVLIVDSFGSVVRSWQGENLPQITDIAGTFVSV
ncbi:MAG: hypothetical protein WBP26_04355 [Candidatus Saccharimonadales bacterium]